MLERYIKHDFMTVSENGSLAEIAQLMQQKKVSSVIVVENKETNPIPTGMLTERDILACLFAENIDLKTVLAKDLMSSPPVLIKNSQGLQEALDTMQHKGVRRALVVDREGKLTGLLAIDDVLVEMINRLEKLANVIKHQLD